MECRTPRGGDRPGVHDPVAGGVAHDVHSASAAPVSGPSRPAPARRHRGGARAQRGLGAAGLAPRPALPSEVAEALYSRHDTIPRDSSVVRRLRTMVDSLNQIIDIEQREHRLPVWTTEVKGKKFGIDSTGIYVAGVRIPAPVLAMLGNLLPQGNFDEALRERHMEDL